MFWLDDAPGEGTLRVRWDTDVHRAVAERVWPTLMRTFWSRFGRWCERALWTRLDEQSCR